MAIEGLALSLAVLYQALFLSDVASQLNTLGPWPSSSSSTACEFVRDKSDGSLLRPSELRHTETGSLGVGPASAFKQVPLVICVAR